MRTMNRRSTAGVLALAALILLSIPSALQARPEPSISVVDLKGSTFQISDLMKGKPTLLVFWATWCRPCRAEIPRITEAYSRFSDDGLVVLAVDPGIRDSLVAVRSYVEHFKLAYPVYFDSEQTSRDAYQLIGTPTVILFDGQGNEVQRGDTVDLKKIEELMGH